MTRLRVFAARFTIEGMRTLLLSCVLLVGCGSSSDFTVAGDDGSVTDSAAGDGAKSDSSSTDTATADTTADTNVGDVASDSVASDSGTIDGGTADSATDSGSEVGCMTADDCYTGMVCCTKTGKCYDPKCLACCMSGI